MILSIHIADDVRKLCTLQSILDLHFKSKFCFSTAHNLSHFWVIQRGKGSSQELSKCDTGEGTQKYRLFEWDTFWLIRCLSIHEYPILMNTPSQFHLNKGRVGKGAGGMLSFVSAGKSCTRYICKKTCTVLLKLCSCDVGDLAIWFISTDTCVVASFWYYSIAQATMFVLWCMNNWFMIYTEKSNDNLYTILECTERCIVLLMLAMILYEENVFF